MNRGGAQVGQVGAGARARAALRGGLRRAAAALLPGAGGGRGAAVRAQPHGLLRALPGLPHGARHAARHPRAAVGLLPAHHHVQARGAAGGHGDAPQQPGVVPGRGCGGRALRGAGRARRRRRGRAAPARAVRQRRAGRLAGATRRRRAPALPRARAHAAAAPGPLSAAPAHAAGLHCDTLLPVATLFMY